MNSTRRSLCKGRLASGLFLAATLAGLLGWAAVPVGATGSSLTVDQIAVETRYYGGGPPGSTAAAISAFNSAPIGFGGYTNAPVLLSDLSYINNQSLAGSPTSIAFHFQIDVTSTGTSVVGLRFGIDFGLGGTFIVDGAEVQSIWTDMWWGLDTSFSNPSQFLQGTVTLSPGSHVIELYGFEGCCDGPTLSQLDLGNGWQTIALGTFYPPALETTPPTVTCAASPSQLWPPNHKMAPIGVQVNVADNESGPAGFILESVTSTEPDNGLGDGDTANDIQGWTLNTADDFGALRAERSGTGSGRIYTLIYRGFDQAGNSATCTHAVTVPHDKG